MLNSDHNERLKKIINFFNLPISYCAGLNGNQFSWESGASWNPYEDDGDTFFLLICATRLWGEEFALSCGQIHDDKYEKKYESMKAARLATMDTITRFILDVELLQEMGHNVEKTVMSFDNDPFVLPNGESVEQIIEGCATFLGLSGEWKNKEFVLDCGIVWNPLESNTDAMRLMIRSVQKSKMDFVAEFVIPLGFYMNKKLKEVSAPMVRYFIATAALHLFQRKVHPKREEIGF